MTLRIESLTHHYRSRLALSAFTAQFEAGHISAILGPNGAGKSTLFKLIAGLMPIQEGTILLDDAPLHQPSQRRLSQIGCVFQEPALDMMRTGRANLRYAAGLHGISKSVSEEAIARTSALLHCEHVLDRVVSQLSGGERRRIEVARALIHQPRWLLLDEPSVGLDIDSRRQLSEDIHHMARHHNMGVIWCTHITDELMRDDHLIIMYQGAVKYRGLCGDPDDVLMQYRSEVPLYV